MILDAHLHVWDRARGDYSWLNAQAGKLWDDFSCHDAHSELTKNGVDQAILVQAAPTIEETLYLLELAGAHAWVAGVIGWIDFDDSSALHALDRLVVNPLLVGIRPMVQDIADPDWLVRPSHAPVFQALSDHHLVFDALVKPDHLPHLIEIATRHVNLSIVIDHAGKPELNGGDPTAWKRDMAALSTLPNCFCKLSGLITQAGPDWTIADLAPVVTFLLDHFGPHKLIWGSDWPVCILAGDYSSWLDAARALLSHLSEHEQAAIFGTTAQSIYAIKDRTLK